MKLPTPLRRSKETPAQETERLLVASTSDRSLQSNGSKAASPLSKWSDKLTDEDHAALATMLDQQHEAASPRGVSPRLLKDEADPKVINFRTREQVAALAALYVTNPAVFAS
jgi:hypothetical protein